MADKNTEEVRVDGMAPFLNSAAFNTYWTFNPSTKMSFWTMFGARYMYFATRYLQHWLYWYDGWVPYFHNANNGIFSTHLAQSLVNRISDKIYGGKLMFKNAGKETNATAKTNDALNFISKWARDCDFGTAVHSAITFANSAGTSLLKANKADNEVWVEALRFDSFVPSVDFRGKVTRVTCFLQQYTDMENRTKDGKDLDYYLVEQRYFGDYCTDKVKLHNVPLVKYSVKRATTIVGTSADTASVTAEDIDFRRLPRKVRESIARDYDYLCFDEPKLLPFDDWLGVELVKASDNVSDIPQLPFGESLLAPIISQLMAYDYYFSAFATDMYTGRGRVLVPAYMIDNKKSGQNYNSGFDEFLYKKVPMANPEDGKPLPVQFALRANDWKTIRDSIIENIAVNIGINTSTLASFLNDTAAIRTAREVSTEENETAGYVNNKRTILEKPINRFLKYILRYNGFTDDVVVRWSSAGLINRQSLTEIINIALNGKFMSPKKAVEMFNYDDDDEQVAEELARVEAYNREQQQQMFNVSPFGNDMKELPE